MSERCYNRLGADNPEGVDVYTSFKEVQAGWPPGWDPALFDRLRAEQQAGLVGLTPDGTQVIAKDSTHDVPQQQPQVVVRAIETVLAKLAPA